MIKYKRHFRRIAACLILLSNLTAARAQTPYHYSLKRELPLLGLGIFSNGTGLFLEWNTHPLTPAEIQQLNPSRINAVDRPATQWFNPALDKATDWLVIGGGIASAAPLLLDRKVRDDFWGIALMGIEAFGLTNGLTHLAKPIFLRPRPFAWNPQVSLEDKVGKSARFSFFSGHTSLSACISFFAAKVYTDLHPKSKWRIPVWVGAFAFPAVTGYLRIRSGQHFPTDVITGLAVGGALGYFVPHLHKKNKATSRLSLSPAPGGASLQWVF